MADFQAVIGSVFSGGANIGVTAIWIIGIIVIGLCIIGGLFLWFWSSRRYNLDVLIRKVRSDGHFISAEIGKGLFNPKRGVLIVKRKKMKGVPIKIIDIRRYLQGETFVEVMQLSPKDFRPILPESFSEHVIEYTDEKTGELIQIKESILNIKIDTGDNEAWDSAYTASSKKAFSISSLMNQFQVPISIAIVVIALFVGFAILWTKLGSICGK